MPQDTIAKFNFHGICGVSNDWFKSYLSSDRIVINIYFFNWDKQPLNGLELYTRKRSAKKIKAYRKSLQKEPTVNRCLLILDLKPFRL